MKRFLLIVGDNYYPEAGTGDWIDMYDTREEALEKVESFREAKMDNIYDYDWYSIVDLENWENGKDADVYDIIPKADQM